MKQSKRKRLGDILIEVGIISPDDLQRALDEQKMSGDRIGQTLIKLGLLSEQDLIQVLEYQLGIPHVNLTLTIPDPSLVRLVPEHMARMNKVIPVKMNGNKLVVAMRDPLDVFLIDDLRIKTAHEIEPAIATENDIAKAIEINYGSTEKKIDTSEFGLESESEEDEALKGESLAEVTDDAPIIRLADAIIKNAIVSGTSDIHIEPQEKDMRVRYRTDGVLNEVMIVPKSAQAALISRFKIMSDMDIAEKRAPQDGRIRVKHNGKDIDLRVNSLPTIYGEKIVCRLLRKDSILLKLEDLGFLPDNLEKYLNIVRSSNGILLVTGPTGSGKTTTLYATLNKKNDPKENIVTVEDPVEYTLKGINQVHVNPKAGLTFASALRAILRQDPDIVMLGEIRDGETAKIAVEAALTGHFVLSTLHTNDAPSSLPRLIDMGVEPYLVSSAVVGILAQRLVRKICPDCKEPMEAPQDEAEVLQSYAQEYLRKNEQFLLDYAQKHPEYAAQYITECETWHKYANGSLKVVYKGRGCRSCNNSGYKGRLAIYEVLTLSPKLKAMVVQKESGLALKEEAVKEGLQLLFDDGMRKVIEGKTTISEVYRVAYAVAE